MFLTFNSILGSGLFLQTLTPQEPLLQKYSLMVFADWWIPTFITKLMINGFNVQVGPCWCHLCQSLFLPFVSSSLPFLHLPPLSLLPSSFPPSAFPLLSSLFPIYLFWLQLLLSASSTFPLSPSLPLFPLLFAQLLFCSNTAEISSMPIIILLCTTCMSLCTLRVRYSLVSIV